MAPVLFAAAAFLTVALVLRRWGLVAVPLIGWPLAYFGATRGWCCNGMVAAGADFAVLVTLTSTAAAVAGVLLGRRRWGSVA